MREEKGKFLGKTSPLHFQSAFNSSEEQFCVQVSDEFSSVIEEKLTQSYLLRNFTKFTRILDAFTTF